MTRRSRRRSGGLLILGLVAMVCLASCSPPGEPSPGSPTSPLIDPATLILSSEATPRGFEARSDLVLAEGDGFAEASLEFVGPEGDVLRSYAATYASADAAGQQFAASRLTLNDDGSILEGAAALGADAVGLIQTDAKDQQSALYLWRQGNVVQMLSLAEDRANTDLWEHLSAEEFHGIAVGLSGATDGT